MSNPLVQKIIDWINRHRDGTADEQDGIQLLALLLLQCPTTDSERKLKNNLSETLQKQLRQKQMRPLTPTRSPTPTTPTTATGQFPTFNDAYAFSLI